MSTTKPKPAGGAIDVTKLRIYVEKHSGLLKDRAALNGEIQALLNQADDAGFDKKAVEAVSKRKNKDRDAAIAFGHKVEEYEVALGLATQDMFSGDTEPDAAAEAKAEAHDDPVPGAPGPKVQALPAPKAKRAKKAVQDSEVAQPPTTEGQDPEPDTEDVAPAATPPEPGDPGYVQPGLPIATEFAYEAGKRAAKLGWAVTRNPYKQDEAAKARWAAGHSDGVTATFNESHAQHTAPEPTPPDTAQDTERAPA
jgi:uncharacterized protein (UPF0335 family)